MFAVSRNFDTTRRRFPMLRMIPKDVWTNAHYTRLQQAAAENDQIRLGLLPDGREAPTAIAELIAEIGTRPTP